MRGRAHGFISFIKTQSPALVGDRAAAGTDPVLTGLPLVGGRTSLSVSNSMVVVMMTVKVLMMAGVVLSLVFLLRVVEERRGEEREEGVYLGGRGRRGRSGGGGAGVGWREKKREGEGGSAGLTMFAACWRNEFCFPIRYVASNIVWKPVL